MKTALVLLPLFWPNMPPLNLALLKAFLKKNGIQADVIDFNNYFYDLVSPSLKDEWKKSVNLSFENKLHGVLEKEYTMEFRSVLSRLMEYDVLGFACYKSNFKFTKEIISMLKAEKHSPKIIMGGPEITRQFFRTGGILEEEFPGLADLFVAGEGELPLLKFLRGEYRSERTVSFLELPDLSNAPGPDYSDFDFDQYPGKGRVALLFSRGCVKKCTFCAECLLYKKFKVYPLESVMDTIRVYKKKDIENFVFFDSLINGDLKALDALCEGIIRNFGSIPWEAQIAVRADMPEELFKKIKKSGCYHLFVGLESGCDTVLRRMQKGFTSSDALDFFKKLITYNLSFGVSMITGFPGETEEEFYQSLNFVLQHKDFIPKIEQVNPFVYYDGTIMPQEADYRMNPVALQRAAIFIEKIKEAGFKYTNAFLMNLVDK